MFEAQVSQKLPETRPQAPECFARTSCTETSTPPLSALLQLVNDFMVALRTFPVCSYAAHGSLRHMKVFNCFVDLPMRKTSSGSLGEQVSMNGQRFVIRELPSRRVGVQGRSWRIRLATDDARRL